MITEQYFDPACGCYISYDSTVDTLYDRVAYCFALGVKQFVCYCLGLFSKGGVLLLCAAALGRSDGHGPPLFLFFV